MSDDTGLEVTRLTVRFGGSVAVDDVSFRAPGGCITGLIGPNGAGKTTTFNACSGLLRPSSGTVQLFGKDVTSLGPAARARLGLGRTFQRVEICTSMSVRTNVALGAEARLAGGHPLRQLVQTPSQRRAIAAATEEALAACELSSVAEQRASTLSTGQLRLVEFARALAARPSLLLLDEPSSGLDQQETVRFGQMIRDAVTSHNMGILLVEHDMSLVMSTCTNLHVLDFGRLIFEGSPRQTQSSAVVRAAYLGDAESGVLV